MRTAAVYAASALLVWFALRWVTPVAHYELLQSSGVRTSGNVVSTECGNHGSFTYTYLVQGQLVGAAGKSSAGGLSCGSLSPGLSIPVVYLPGSPSQSVAGDPALALSEARLFASGAALFFPGIVLCLKRRARATASAVGRTHLLERWYQYEAAATRGFGSWAVDNGFVVVRGEGDA